MSWHCPAATILQWLRRHQDARRLAKVDAAAHVSAITVPTLWEAPQRERDVVLPDGITHAGRTPAHSRAHRRAQDGHFGDACPNAARFKVLSLTSYSRMETTGRPTRIALLKRQPSETGKYARVTPIPLYISACYVTLLTGILTKID